ncbi:Verru_Chthon cassette protein B [Verrucomicrobium sp. GAS474]|uniref:Verru_Chthon cassette protein B n=1 Tax=Verrucomicrobium sp. GAS474 TaxID=1882831 RepID=UPI00210128EC|nr:Verru_Chthon cassette protein B [Verrucomicrobium sp. GAS474]
MHSFLRSRPRRRAFSLVELLVALGIVCFALVPLLGLVPVGLASFRHAMNLNAQALIFQALSSESSLLDYSVATNSASAFSQSFPRFYDGTGARLTATRAGAVFEVSLNRVAFAAPGGTASAANAQKLGFSLTNLSGKEKTQIYSVVVVNNGN